MLNNKQKKYSLISFISLISLSLLSLSFSPSIKAQTNNKQAFNQQKCIEKLVKQGLAQNQADGWCLYEKECLVRSQQEGLTFDMAESVCDCSIKEFRKQYTIDKFKELNNAAKTNQEIANKLKEVGETCFEDILFEE